MKTSTWVMIGLAVVIYFGFIRKKTASPVPTPEAPPVMQVGATD
jgi:hypothetical protein